MGSDAGHIGAAKLTREVRHIDDIGTTVRVWFGGSRWNSPKIWSFPTVLDFSGNDARSGVYFQTRNRTPAILKFESILENNK